MKSKRTNFAAAAMLPIAILAGIGLFAVMLPYGPAAAHPVPANRGQAQPYDADLVAGRDSPGGAAASDGITQIPSTPDTRVAGNSGGQGVSASAATTTSGVVPGANGPTPSPRVFTPGSEKPGLQPPRPPAWLPSPTAGITPTPAPASPPPAGGYYVATTGNDAASGSISGPWKTLQRAANSAPSGATIYVRGGTYGPFSITRSGLTFTQYPGETAIVKGDASNWNTIEINGVTSARLSYLTVTGNVLQYGSGIAVDSSSGVTLSHLSVHDNTSFGIRTSRSSALIEQSAVYLNHTGIEVAHEGTVTIRNNNIHDNNKWIDPGVGAQGISFYYTTGSVLAANNRLWGNHTLANDPLGPEGKAFEIYAAKNVTMTGNVTYDNRQVLESGTDSARTPCTNLTFTKNVSYRSGSDTQMGLILRCFDHSLVAANTFVSLDLFAFDLSSDFETYGGSVEGLRILDNLIVNGRTYSIDNPIPASVVMDYNLAYTTSAATAQYGTYDAWVVGHDQTTSVTQFRSWTGQGAHDVWGANPLLNANYCPSPGSPAINAGLAIGLAYSGSAPDLGYCEVA